MPTATTSRARRAGADLAQEASEESRQVAQDAAGEAREVASSAGERGGALAGRAKQDARDVVQTAMERAGDVTEELSTQSRSLLNETTGQLQTQARAAAQQAAENLQRLGSEAQALAEGRPEDAPVLTDYAWKMADGLYGAADRLHGLAEDVETRGFSGVLEDLSAYARRRPGAFLLGAAAVGFGVGRLVKAGAGRRQPGQEEAPAEPITTRVGS